MSENWRVRPRPKYIGNVKIIRDINDFSQDYWLPEERAEELFNEGKLIKIEAYANKWSYATKNPDEYYE